MLTTTLGMLSTSGSISSLAAECWPKYGYEGIYVDIRPMNSLFRDMSAMESHQYHKPRDDVSVSTSGKLDRRRI